MRTQDRAGLGCGVRGREAWVSPLTLEDSGKKLGLQTSASAPSLASTSGICICPLVGYLPACGQPHICMGTSSSWCLGKGVRPLPTALGVPPVLSPGVVVGEGVARGTPG